MGGNLGDCTSALLDALFASGGPTSKCLLCSAPSELGALFLPNDAQLWGAPAGKHRMVGYGLCGACYDRPDLTDVVEARIFAFVAGGAA